MHPRRSFVLALLTASRPSVAGPATAAGGEPAVRLPADFGAHPGAAIEWWYLTGALAAESRSWGFQITFFRAATGLANRAADASRFAAREVVFAHAAVTDLQQRRLRHDQRAARSGFGIADAGEGETRLLLRDWRLSRRSGAVGRSRYETNAGSEGAGFAFRLALEATQPPLLQGHGGLSQKGPNGEQSSRYYSEPQLAASGSLAIDGRSTAVTGTAWLDHEWSNSFLDPAAVGWDWIGMNLDDGSALTAFRVRASDGAAVWAGGSFRGRDGATRNFGNGDVAFTPGRVWQSAASKARYPVEWQVSTPAGRFSVQAMLDDQELDSRASTGAIYWEGLSELLDPGGRRVGRGYLEMTGYAGRLVL